MRVAHPIVTVDAFTAVAYAGNPAAVCRLERAPHDENWLRAVAREMNLSETAFLWPEPAAPVAGSYRIRWFTPRAEVDLCGHATLASAHLLWEDGLLGPDETAHFVSRGGLLTARRTAGSWIELDFPAEPVAAVAPPARLLESLGLSTALFVGRNRARYLVEIASAETLRQLQPDFADLSRVPPGRVVVTTRSPEQNGGFDFLSRYFAPGIGVNEDPATGAAHCALAPYWAQRLGITTELLALQVSERGGVLRVRATDHGRVLLGGQAVTVMRGELAW